jgi:hypothetical protein
MTKDPQDTVYHDIYERLDAGDNAAGSVLRDLAGMNLDEMEDYFGDLDPAEFL